MPRIVLETKDTEIKIKSYHETDMPVSPAAWVVAAKDLQVASAKKNSVCQNNTRGTSSPGAAKVSDW